MHFATAQGTLRLLNHTLMCYKLNFIFGFLAGLDLRIFVFIDLFREKQDSI